MVTVTHAEIAAAAVALLVVAAEVLHARRCRRLARLAFGPARRPAAWARLAPALRVIATTALCWGLVTLLELPPGVHVARTIPDNQRRHVVIVLDVSPSMRLKDAGPNADESRMKRASAVMESFLDRVPVELYLLSVVACYNGSKPVVVDTKDLEVVRNIFGDLPMHYAFAAGKTDLFSGLAEAARIAHPWQPKSTLLLMISDGDTVPAVGMPKMPASIADVLIVGVGDPRQGSFIDGRMSRQDSSTLRQIAARLGGTYHDGNAKHIPTATIRGLAVIPRQGAFERLTRREYALIACALGASVYACLPLLLHLFGTRWRPGVRLVETRPPRRLAPASPESAPAVGLARGGIGARAETPGQLHSHRTGNPI